MGKYANENSGTNYLLVDNLSRYFRAQPLKIRYATTVKDAFLKMINIDDPFSIQLNYGQIKENSSSVYLPKLATIKKLKFIIHPANPEAGSRRTLKCIKYKYFEHSGGFARLTNCKKLQKISIPSKKP